MHPFSSLARHIAGAALLAATAAQAAPTVYFGEDQGAFGPGSMPNALAAQSQFLSRLAGTGSQSFEGYDVGFDFFANPGASFSFGSTGVSGTLTGSVVQNNGFGNRFAVDGSNYLNAFFNQRVTFSAPVAAFGLFVTDANELDNDPATVTVGGVTLPQAQIEARPFDSVDGIFRIVTERSPGNFEVLFDGGAFPAADATGMFVGLVDAANPFSNILLINGASGLDGPFTDGFGYAQMTIGTPIPEPSTWALLGLGLLGVGAAARRRA